MKALNTEKYSLHNETYFEVEIELNNKDKVYSNIIVEDGEKEEEVYDDGFWIYNKSHKEVNYENIDNDYASLDKETTKDIANMTIDLWNSQI